MTTQRDRLAAVLLSMYREQSEYERQYCDWLADALLARGVRVVDADTLAAAFAKADVTLYERGKWRGLNERTDAETIIAALDAEP